MENNVLTLSKRTVRYADAPDILGISPSTLRRYAIKHNLIYKLNQTCLVDVDQLNHILCSPSPSRKRRGKIEFTDDSDFKKSIGRKFITFKEGAYIYSISESKFRREAQLAGAVVKIGRSSRVRVDLFESHLRLCRITDEHFYKSC